MSETAESFHETNFRFLAIISFSQRLAAPRKRSHIYFFCRPGSNKLDQHFSRLLTFLCADDPDEAGRRYLSLHKKLEGYFRTRGVADTSAAADETLDRAGRRIAEGTDVPNINSFCLGIARFIIMESWRLNTRESAAFLKFLEQHEQATADQIHRLSLMKQCFEQLPYNERDLLDSYCKALRGQARAQHRRDLAESLSTNVAALRIRVTRLRKDLEDCVKNLSKNYW